MKRAKKEPECTYKQKVEIMKQTIKGQTGGVRFKFGTVDTGRYKYVMKAYYEYKIGMYMSVTKISDSTSKEIGTVMITKYSQYGFEYDGTVIGTIPKSVSKRVKQFILDVNNIS